MTLPTRADLMPGDIGFARHVLPKSADLLITAGQVFLGEPAYPHHVFVVVEASVQGLGGPRIVQAMPSGAEEIEAGPSFWNEGYLYIRPAYALGQGVQVAEAARRYIGRPYSFADYAALALHKVRNRGYVPINERTWLERYVSSSGRMICSQLADQSLTDADWHSFNDNRLPQDVTPAALCRQLGRMPGRHVQPGLSWEINVFPRRDA